MGPAVLQGASSAHRRQLEPGDRGVQQTRPQSRREAGMPPILPSTPISTSGHGRACARCARCWRTFRRSSCSTITRRRTTGTSGLSWVRMLHNKNDALRLWPKTLTDGLAAYWIYQGWCNKAPSQWPASDLRIKALRDAQATGRDALPDLRRYIHANCFAQEPPSGPKATFQTGLGSTGTTGCPSIRPSWCPTAARENSWLRRTRRFASSTTTIRRAGRCRRPSIPRSSTGCARSW